MNTTKHTPGPWLIATYESFGNVLSPHSKNKIAMVYDAGVNSQGIGVANAQLIAAAPDLLEACKAVLHCNDYAEGKISAEFSDVLDKVSEAIAKADPEACYKLKKAGAQ